MSHSLLRAGAILRKDILIELRTRQALLSMTLFALLTVLILAFAFEPTLEETKMIGPGLLWVAFAFAGTIGLEQTLSTEREEGGMEGLLLAPLDRGLIYAAKLIANTLFMIIAETLTLPFFVIFYNIDLVGFLPALLLINLLGTVGFCAVGTLLSTITAQTKLRGVLLPVILFPMIVPVFLAAVEGTSALFRGESMTGALRLLAVYDIVFVTGGYLTFGYVVEE